MTLPGTVLFPHAMLPLHIFEERYCEMLAKILVRDRIFAVAALDAYRAESTQEFEPPCPVATVGIIRACHENEDNTANLILQGLARVHVHRIVHEEPFRVIEISPLVNRDNSDESAVETLRHQLTDTLEAYSHLDARVTGEIMSFLRSLQDSEAFLDLTAYTLCNDSNFKQRILESVDIAERYQICTEYFRNENVRLKLERKLRGKLDDEDICLN